MTTDYEQGPVTEADRKTVPQMKDVIAGMTDPAELRALAASDDRSMVRDAVAAQLGRVMLDAPDVLTPSEALVASLTGELVETSEDIFANSANAEAQRSGETGAVSSGTVTHKTEPFVMLYSRNTDGPAKDIYGPVLVPRNNVGDCIRSGYKPACPHCNSQTCRVSLVRPVPGQQSDTVFDCPSLTRRPFMRCPICVKKFHDPLDPNFKPVDGKLEEGEINSAGYAQVTPQARIESRMDRHMLAFHPEEATTRGIRQPAPDPSLTEQDRLKSPVGA